MSSPSVSPSVSPSGSPIKPTGTQKNKFFREGRRTTIRSYRNKMKPSYELLKNLEDFTKNAGINATRINVSNKFEEIVKPEFKKPEYNPKTEVKNTIDNNVPGLDLDNLTNKLFDIVPIDPNKQIDILGAVSKAIENTDDINNVNNQGPKVTTGGKYLSDDKAKELKKILVKAISTEGEIPAEDGELSDEENEEVKRDTTAWGTEHAKEYSEVDFQKIVNLLEKRVNQLISHPILTKIKSYF